MTLRIAIVAAAALALGGCGPLNPHFQATSPEPGKVVVEIDHEALGREVGSAVGAMAGPAGATVGGRVGVGIAELLAGLLVLAGGGAGAVAARKSSEASYLRGKESGWDEHAKEAKS